MPMADVRRPDDERVLALLSGCRHEDPKRIARALLQLSIDVDPQAAIATTAIHIAAEADTDGEYAAATAAWEKLLVQHGLHAADGTDSATVMQSVRVGRSEPVRASFKVPATVR